MASTNEQIAVVNASPLIALSNAGHPRLLLAIADRILVPRAVAEEIARLGTDDPTQQLLNSEKWLGVVDVPAAPATVRQADLGAGETAVLSLGASAPNLLIVIDDAAARRCARQLGLSVMGTLRVVVRAKQRGIISSADAVFRDLATAGLYVSERVLSALRQEAGE